MWWHRAVDNTGRQISQLNYPGTLIWPAAWKHGSSTLGEIDVNFRYGFRVSESTVVLLSRVAELYGNAENFPRQKLNCRCKP